MHIDIVMAWAAVVILGAPFIFFACIQGSFFLYHALVHGNAFYEKIDAPADTHEIASDNTTQKRQKKLCPVCKRHTRCKVKKSKAGFWIHILRN